MSHPTQLLSAFLDGELTREERRKVMAHLSGCAACRDELAGLQVARSAVRSLIVLEPPADLIPGQERPEHHYYRIPLWAAAAAAAILALFIGVATLVGPRTTLEVRLDQISNQYGARTSLDPSFTPGQVIPVVQPVIGGAE